MNFHILCAVLASDLLALANGFCDEERTAPVPPQPPLSRAGLGALEHASKLVAAINALDWKIVDASVSSKDPFLPLLKRDATTQKDWPGVGAYRGSDLDPERHTVRHRFAYGATRTTPHELWLIYSISGDEFTLDSILILGW